MSSKTEFIEVLAEYLAGDQCRQSIELERGTVDAKMWSKVRGATPLFGYPTVKEAVVTLTNFLG